MVCVDLIVENETMYEATEHFDSNDPLLPDLQAEEQAKLDKADLGFASHEYVSRLVGLYADACRRSFWAPLLAHATRTHATPRRSHAITHSDRPWRSIQIP